MNYQVIQGNCLEILPNLPKAKCLFADPPDNLGLSYDSYKDKISKEEYKKFLLDCFNLFLTKADIVWISFYYRWLGVMGQIVEENLPDDWNFKPAVQIFTFGNYNSHDLTNCYRPIWRFNHKNAIIYPENVMVESARQKLGDKRASPTGRVISDVFDVPRVVGNSKERRKWTPTQLGEKLVEQCILFSTKEGDSVIESFGGSGVCMRVCKRIDRKCTTIELSANYCKEIKKDNLL